MHIAQSFIGQKKSGKRAEEAFITRSLAKKTALNDVAMPKRFDFSVNDMQKMAKLGMIPQRGVELVGGDVMFGARRKRFSIEEYYQLADVGILPSSTRATELLNGDILTMSPVGSRHFAAVAMLQYHLHQALGNEACIAVQSTILLPLFRSAPEPDIAILRFRNDFYRHELPTANDVLLLIEVADSTLKYDSGVKAKRYAMSGISELWIVDVRRRQLELCRKPSNKGFTERRIIANDETIHLAALPHHSFKAATLLGTEIE